MAKKKKSKVENSEVDLTSMIDVCFLLIAFFIMVTEVSKAEIVEIFLPIATFAEDDVPDESRLIVNIDRKGEVYIRSTEYGKPTTGKEKLLTDLQSYSEGAGFSDEEGNPSNLTIMIRADAHAEYRYVQCVMQLLVDPNVKIKKVHYQSKKNKS